VHILLGGRCLLWQRLASKMLVVRSLSGCCGAFSGGTLVQLCLHDKVSKMAGQAANFTCRALVARKQYRW
jgi:hypothetical protein